MEYTIQVKGGLVSLREPQVMGILNCTPDSFFAGSRVQTEESIARRANQIIEEGGTMIDVGGFSTRPGGVEVPEEEEMRRLRFALPIVRREQPEAILSVDTYRPNVARMVVEEMGADIINDVSEGGITGVVDTPLEQTTDEYPAIFRTVADLGVPYILMSVKPTIHDMLLAMAREVQQLRDLGQKDIILDPGFGFGKTQEQNYDVLREMNRLSTLGLPILAGMSRKRMIFQPLGTNPDGSLNGTTVVNTLALMNGASILRVHDVKAAAEAVRLFGCYPDTVMFFEFGIKDVIDILLVALMLYYLYRVMKESRSLNVFIGIMVFVLVWLFVSQVLEMRLLGSIMDKLVSVGVIGIIVLFQEEIRHFLYNLGARRQVQSVLRIFFSNKDEEKADKEAIMPIVMACMSMSRGKVGALIVIERGISLSDICDTGDYIDARINQRLIENIFFKNSPLHDGAMVITKKRIRAAGCILPVSHNQDIPKELGLRHRAAMGISQDSDAIAIVVSEETGRISVAIKGEFQLRLSAEQLESVLTKEMMPAT